MGNLNIYFSKVAPNNLILNEWFYGFIILIRLLYQASTSPLESSTKYLICLSEGCKQLDYQLVHFLSHGEDQFDEISMQIKRIVSIEDFIHQLETGKENCTESYHWKMIQLDDDDEDGRCNLQHMYEDHISKLEKERIR